MQYIDDTLAYISLHYKLHWKYFYSKLSIKWTQYHIILNYAGCIWSVSYVIQMSLDFNDKSVHIISSDQYIGVGIHQQVITW